MTNPEPRSPSRERDRIRVVYLAHTFAVGGAEEMVLNLVRHLPPRFEPMVCCINEAGPIGAEIARTGTPVSVLGLTPGLRHPWHLAGIRRYLRDVQPDIVHTFLLTASLYGRLAAVLERVPIVIGTEVNIYERKRSHHILAERLLMNRTDRVIVSARSVREFYIRQIHADPAKVDVIYNAVDWSMLQPAESPATRARMRASLGLAPDAKVAGVIARLTEQKGHRFLFEALAAPSLADVHLLVVGDGDLRDSLRVEAAAAGHRFARALPWRPPRSGRFAGRDRRVRDAVALGRTSALAHPRDGCGAAGRCHGGRRHSRGRRAGRDRLARAARRRTGSRSRR